MRLQPTSAHDLAVALLEHRDRPKFVLVDEGSTHFDNRTNSYEVASQWSPMQKRMSKVGTEVVGVIDHTEKDVDPEAKRLTNLAFWEEKMDSVDFFSDWPADSDMRTNYLAVRSNHLRRLPLPMTPTTQPRN